MKMILNVLASLIAAGLIGLAAWFWLAPPSVSLRMDTGTINAEQAPFEVPIQGTVARAQKSYLYLIVDDGNAEWVQPGLGYGYDGEFFAKAYLGIKDDTKSRDKWYSIFVVVCSQEHKKYEHLDRKTTLAISQIVRFYRTQ